MYTTMNLIKIFRRSLISSIQATNRFAPYSSLTKQPLRPSHAASTTATASRSCCNVPNLDHEKQSPSVKHPPSAFDFDGLQSLSNPYVGEIYVKRADELKEMVKKMLVEEDDNYKMEAVDLLVLIDDLQRLGLNYHFETHIKQALINIYNKSDTILHLRPDDLYYKALFFRLFRQHGFNVSQDIFDCFKDVNGFYKTSICKDIKGMLYLYEASFLSVKGERNLDLAREFTEKHLRKSVDGDDQEIDNTLAALVHHALKLPLHWRSSGLEARWFIDIYEARTDMNPLVLKLAKLDSNILQSIHHDDLKDAARVWKTMGLSEELTYVRKILVPCYVWIGEILGEPQYAYARRIMTVISMFGTVLDDTYDTHGTLDELELFTDSIERWDIHSIDQLPHYMKVIFLAIYNFINQIAYDVLKKHGITIISFLKNVWADYCKAYLVEAKWLASGYEPTLEEYIKNGSVSIGVAVAFLHISLLVDNPVKRETLEAIMSDDHDILRNVTLIARLSNDIGTRQRELKKGDLMNSVQCYMNETGASEEQAQEHIRVLISETWKTINKDRFEASPFSETFMKVAIMNVVKTAPTIYGSGAGDGFDNGDKSFQDQIVKLYFKPIPIEDL